MIVRRDWIHVRDLTAPGASVYLLTVLYLRGPTTCVSPFTCTYSSAYYSQVRPCLYLDPDPYLPIDICSVCKLHPFMRLRVAQDSSGLSQRVLNIPAPKLGRLSQLLLYISLCIVPPLPRVRTSACAEVAGPSPPRCLSSVHKLMKMTSERQCRGLQRIDGCWN